MTRKIAERAVLKGNWKPERKQEGSLSKGGSRAAENQETCGLYQA